MRDHNKYYRSVGSPSVARAQKRRRVEDVAAMPPASFLFAVADIIGDAEDIRGIDVEHRADIRKGFE